MLSCHLFVMRLSSRDRESGIVLDLIRKPRSLDDNDGEI
jgi:hypothetical protein